MKKWRNLTDDEADEELRQIALERQILEDAFTEPPMETNLDKPMEPIPGEESTEPNPDDTNPEPIEE